MRAHILRFIAANTLAIALVAAVSVPILAVDEPAATMQTTAAPAPTPEVEQKMRTDRIAERKAAVKTKLTATQQKRIQTRCKAAQGKINESIKKATVVQQNRSKAHSNVTSRLNDFETRVAAQGIDTTNLKAQLVVLQTKIDTFDANLKLYTDAVNDTAALDCVADPVAFKASLESGRAALATVRADTVGIRSHVNQMVKPTMVVIKTQLAAAQGAN